MMGIKKDFSKDPIDYQKIRRADVHKPKGSFYKKDHIKKFSVLESQITEIALDKDSDKLLIFLHGGAFISGPSKLHWDTAKKIAKNTNHTIWVCDYPKAPENKISKISENVDAIYHAALEQYDANQIYFMGDSVGGTLIIGLTQRLINKQLALPNKIIAISPVMDASMTNPDIGAVDQRDPMLSKKGLLSAKIMCSENNHLKDPMISPLYGSFEGFPPTILYIAENDITYPDQKIAVEKLLEANVKLDLIDGKNMPHIWPLLPVMKEAKTSLDKIIETLNN